MDWTLPCEFSRIAELTTAVRHATEPVIGSEASEMLEMALAEALNNIAEHGYPEGSGPGPVTLHLEPEATHAVTVTLEDRGRPIPTAAFEAGQDGVAEFDPDQIEALPEGGMGLGLIHMLIDEISYSSQGGRNRLVLRQHRRAAPA